MKLKSPLKGLIPFLGFVFLNSFIDLAHKILIQNTLYKTVSGTEFIVLSSIIAFLILLPYILLFTPAGFLSDRFSKTNILRLSALANIMLTILITVSYFTGWFWFSFALIFALTFQSAICSPAQYGFIREIFGGANLGRVNALVKFMVGLAMLLAIFIFTIVFSDFLMRLAQPAVLTKAGVLKLVSPAGFLLILCAILQTLLSLQLAKSHSVNSRSNYSFKSYFMGRHLREYLGLVKHNHIVSTSIISLAVLWAINQVLLISYGIFLKINLAHVGIIFIQGVLIIGAVGVLVGLLFSAKSSDKYIETNAIPFALLGMTAALFFIPYARNFLWVLCLFFFYGFCFGLLLAPLNALIQFHAPKEHLAKFVAAKNFVQCVFMSVFLLVSVPFVYTHLGSLIDLRILFIFSLVILFYLFWQLPQSFVRYIIYFVGRKFYKVKVIGLEHFPATGGVLLIGNYTSFLDWAIIQISSPRSVHFVMEKYIYEKWYLKLFLHRLNIIVVDKLESDETFNATRELLLKGKVVAFFPESYLHRHAQVSEFHPGFEKAIVNTKAVIIPFYLRGLWGTFISYGTSAYQSVLSPRTLEVGIAYGRLLSASTKALEVRQHVVELSIKSWKNYSRSLTSIQAQWLKRAKELGNEFCVADSTGKNLSYHQLIAAVMLMTKKLKGLVKREQNIGVILPPCVGGVIANLAIFCLGKTAVDLNYTTGEQIMLYAIQKSNVKTIITSKLFAQKLKPRGLDLTDVLSRFEVLYLEDYHALFNRLNILKKLILIKLLPYNLLKLIAIKKQYAEEVAVILFSSGSEGHPKGVELTHRNILGNARQVFSVITPQEKDVMLSSLPLFHAFGLTTTTILPLIQGMPFVCYPDPKDAVGVGKMVYRYQATIMCGTSSFYGLYVRHKKLKPIMFQSLRLVVAGAEKLSPQVREGFKEKFGLEIFEGYGVTEVSPVASANLPNVLDPDTLQVHISNKPGTVGLPLPGSAFKIVDPDTYQPLPVGEEGLILIGGTQVMRGYLDDPLKTHEVLIKDRDLTWYKSGDKGKLDSDGFLTIVDRYSRFIKIAGETVSLTAVETCIRNVLETSEVDVMAVGMPDPRKGEQVVLLHLDTMDADAIRHKLLAAHLDQLMLPAYYIALPELPKLGSGKKDYVAGKKLALEKFV